MVPVLCSREYDGIPCNNLALSTVRLPGTIFYYIYWYSFLAQREIDNPRMLLAATGGCRMFTCSSWPFTFLPVLDYRTVR